MEHNSAEDCNYRWTIALPLPDHLIHQMLETFGEQQIIASKFLCIEPSFLCKDSTLNLDEVLEFYRDDLPNLPVVGNKMSIEKLSGFIKVVFPLI